AAAKAEDKKAESGSASGALSGLGSLAGAIGSSPSGSGAGSSENKVGAALDLAKAASVTDEEIKASSLQYRQYEEKKSKMAPAGNKYAQRLARLTRKHLNEDGLKLNYKVILDPNVNANATADGSIRFYSGIMDMMTDQEILAVVGHEIGHVKYGHTLSKTRTALLASAARKAAASSGGKAGILADSELGGFGERMFNAQFSQSAEYEADDYALAFMKKHKYDPKALESVFRKLASLSGKKDSVSQMLSTHPDAAARADRVRDLLAKK
ncbi:MAG: M48 family metalloprotease, partial [Casimicrobium sp.]